MAHGEVKATFYNSVTFDDKITIKSRVTRLGTSSLQLSHRWLCYKNCRDADLEALSRGRAGAGDFKWRHFRGEIILWGVRWYCKCGISYRNREEMLEEWGVIVDHTTLYRWVQHYAPEMAKRLRWYWKRRGFHSAGATTRPM